MSNDELIQELELIGYKRDINSDFTTPFIYTLSQGTVFFHLIPEFHGYIWGFIYDGRTLSNRSMKLPSFDMKDLASMILLYKDM